MLMAITMQTVNASIVAKAALIRQMKPLSPN
jgi:hypothetical protein